MSKTQPARGMRDFLPSDVRKRNYVIGIIKEVYEKYGFEPLETPSVENLETLTGKYGEEGSQLMFKILKRGEKLQEELAEGNIKSENELSDLALRYDLTVPLARVVANYKNELPKFFKRYQIQPVWRADRPAKGRYREFYQCDVDAIGSSSMIVETELCKAIFEILWKLGFRDFQIKLNHRKLLNAILDNCGIPTSSQKDALIALDKLDKIGNEGVAVELEKMGISIEFAKKLLKFNISIQNLSIEIHQKYLENIEDKLSTLIDQKKDLDFNEAQVSINAAVLEKISDFIGGHKEGEEGLSNLRQLLSLSGSTKNQNNYYFSIDPSLARGLSYYTGAIFEVVLTKGDFAGSLAGGGRYDGLIGMFGKEQIPAVGFSIGLERIIFVMEERGMFPDDLTTNSADVMVTLWNEDAAGESLKLAGELRAEGLRVLVYPEADKLGKQFKYADSINIPFVCVIGETELAENKVTLKNMKTGEQETVSREEIIEKIK